MDAQTTRLAIMFGGAGLLGLVAYNAAKKAAGAVADGVAKVAKAADTAVAAPVLTAGDALGIPRTDMTECEKAMAEGRTLDASFACPAGDFLAYLARGKPAAASPAAARPDLAQLPSPMLAGVTFNQASQAGYDWTDFGLWGVAP